MTESAASHRSPLQEFLAQLRDRGVEAGRKLADVRGRNLVEAGMTPEEACDAVGKIAMAAAGDIIDNSQVVDWFDADALVYVERNIIVALMVGFAERYDEISRG